MQKAYVVHPSTDAQYNIISIMLYCAFFGGEVVVNIVVSA